MRTVSGLGLLPTLPGAQAPRAQHQARATSVFEMVTDTSLGPPAPPPPFTTDKLFVTHVYCEPKRLFEICSNILEFQIRRYYICLSVVDTVG